jgi:hypothetical protein
MKSGHCPSMGTEPRRVSRRSLSAPTLLGLVFFLAACAVPTDISIDRSEGSVETTGNENIVMLFTGLNKSFYDETFLFKCLESEFENESEEKPKVIDTVTFQDAMFPWFEDQTAPKTVSDLNNLLTRPVVRQRISSMNIRYLVNIEGGTISDDSGYPGLFCGGAGYGAGCIGLGQQNKTTKLNAIIWDLSKGTKAGDLSVTSAGQSVIPAFIVPFPFLAYTEADACERFASELRKIMFEG